MVCFLAFFVLFFWHRSHVIQVGPKLPYAAKDDLRLLVLLTTKQMSVSDWVLPQLAWKETGHPKLSQLNLALQQRLAGHFRRFN